MRDIIITDSKGTKHQASIATEINPFWQELSPSEFLYKWLLKNLPVHAREEGMEDESRKVLKYNGKTVFEAGDEEAWFEDINYKVVELESEESKIEHENYPVYDVLESLSEIQKQEIKRLRAMEFQAGYEKGLNEAK